ncbi:MAG: MBOAT family O-acyltransferase [Armatimonadota bacterium]
MVFSSHLFIFYFLPAALAAYYLAPRRWRHLILTLFSYVFYGWANPKFTILMLISTLIDYLCGLAMAKRAFAASEQPVEQLEKGASRTRWQKTALVISIVSNLSLLGFFKYFNFGVDNYNSLMSMLGLSHLQWETVLKVTLPLGISFYTFQSMSYSIDLYRGNTKVMRNFIDFACFVSMFPQLVAGPIIRFSEVADQLQNRTHTMDKFARGVALFSMGMAKKIMLANPCGKIADTVFNAGSVGTFDSWYGLLAYAFQIYFDFSGYSDMAIGLGLMLGFVFPKNFDMPYKSESITEFWQRWHISLSSWLRDYLYIPLGGNRKGKVRTYINLAVVMLLGGLWHGAAWNYIIWGGIHGGMLAFERSQGKTSLYNRFPRILKIGITFLTVLIAWVFFRANGLHGAGAYLSSMIGMGNPQTGSGLISGIIYQPYYVISLIAAAAITWGWSDSWYWTQNLSLRKAVVCVGLLWLSIALLVTQAYNPFIYFIF